MKNHVARKIAKAATKHTAKLHAGNGVAPPSPAQPGTASNALADSPINFASINQIASYPPRNSGNPGNN